MQRHQRRSRTGYARWVEDGHQVEEGNACLTDPPKRNASQGHRLRFARLRHRTSHGAFKFKGRQSCILMCYRRSNACSRFSPWSCMAFRVPKEEWTGINAAGGKIAGSMGVDANEYLPAAKLGVTKVNIDTDGRLVWTRVHREFFRDKRRVRFPPPGKIFIEEYAKFIASRNQLLGSAGQLPAVRDSLK